MNIIFAGVGGQGVILAGKVLMQAAKNAGFDVKESEVHGMAQRGGSVDCQVRYGEKIHSPLVPKGKANYLVSFEKLELIRKLDYLASDGTAIVNMLQVNPSTVDIGSAEYPSDLSDWLDTNVPNCVKINSESALKEIGSNKVVNILMLGVLSKYLEFKQEDWERAINSNKKKKFIEMNLKAFELGRKLL
jgi:indolepyruvate ferredoxin oxidoreductase beta subunit